MYDPSMSLISIRAAVGLVVFTLTGCSSSSQIAVTSSGAIPTRGAYTVVEGVSGDISRSVADVLARQGLTKSESPNYVVQLSYAERPAGTGLLVPLGSDPQWLGRPDFYNRKRPVVTLGISIAEVANGRELYHASASGPPHSKKDAWLPLLRALFPTAPTRGADQDLD